METETGDMTTGTETETETETEAEVASEGPASDLPVRRDVEAAP